MDQNEYEIVISASCEASGLSHSERIDRLALAGKLFAVNAAKLGEGNGIVFVPLQFFTDVFGMGNSYYEDRVAHINNEERVE